MIETTVRFHLIKGSMKLRHKQAQVWKGERGPIQLENALTEGMGGDHGQPVCQKTKSHGNCDNPGHFM